MSEVKYNAGDRVVIVDPICSFNEYERGDKATVESVDRDGDLIVAWDKPFYDDPVAEGNRVTLLHVSEVTHV